MLKKNHILHIFTVRFYAQIFISQIYNKVSNTIYRHAMDLTCCEKDCSLSGYVVVSHKQQVFNVELCKWYMFTRTLSCDLSALNA